MTITTQRRWRRLAVAGASGIAVVALFASGWPGADQSTVASGQVRLVDQTIALPPNVTAALPSWVMPLLQQVDADSSADGDDSSVGTDDSSAGELQQELLQQQQDQDEANLSENNAIQSMIQSQQQAELQNDQAEQQFTQDELQAQQTEQEANQP
jgi:hypothetical protein